jgi:hypothetical protein
MYVLFQGITFATSFFKMILWVFNKDNACKAVLPKVTMTFGLNRFITISRYIEQFFISLDEGVALFPFSWFGLHSTAFVVETHGQSPWHSTPRFQASLDLNPGVLATSHTPRSVLHSIRPLTQNSPVTTLYALSNILYSTR